MSRLSCLAGLILALSVVVRPVSAQNAWESCRKTAQFGFDETRNSSADKAKLIALTEWVRDSIQVPILSITISRHGKIIYFLKTGGVGDNDAHYLMSVTKSVTSALVGVALQKAVVKNIDLPVVDLLPATFLSETGYDQSLRRVTLRNALDMSALDAPVPPHLKTAEAEERQRAFNQSTNRARFALSQRALPRPGLDFLYTDITPYLTGAVLQHGFRQSLFDIAQQTLFGPMGFANAEWMHQDARGYDNPAYGLRLRPTDMQKFGNLYLSGGCWGETRLLPAEWVARSFRPQYKSRAELNEPDYGLGWWSYRVAGRQIHEANGWKGQRISVIPEFDAVVTMTASIEDGSEQRVYLRLLRDYIIPALNASPSEHAGHVGADRLLVLLAEVARQPRRLPAHVEQRMVPQATARQVHRTFTP